MAKDKYDTALASSAYVNIGLEQVEAGLILEDGSVLKVVLPHLIQRKALTKKDRHFISLEKTDKGILRRFSFMGLSPVEDIFNFTISEKDYWGSNHPEVA